MIVLVHICIVIFFVAYMRGIRNFTMSQLTPQALPVQDIKSKCAARQAGLGHRARAYVVDLSADFVNGFLGRAETQKGMVQMVLSTFLTAALLVNVLYFIGSSIFFLVVRTLLLAVTVVLSPFNDGFREELRSFKRIDKTVKWRKLYKQYLRSVLSVGTESTVGNLGFDWFFVNTYTIRNGLRQHFKWLFRGQPPYIVEDVNALDPKFLMGQVYARKRMYASGAGTPILKFNMWVLAWALVAYLLSLFMESDKPPTSRDFQTEFDVFTFAGVALYVITVLVPKFGAAAA